MDLKLTTATGKASSKKLAVSDATFAREFNEALVHQAVTAYMATGRQGSKAQKTRSEVRGGGRKPFKQKGTGRARAGTIRSPIWRSGGVTFAAKPRDYSQKLNKKMYVSAMRSILSELVRQDRLVVVDDFDMDAPKTKELFSRLQGLGVIDGVMIIVSDLSESLFKSAANIPHVGICDVAVIDPVSLLRYEKVLMTVSAVKKVEEKLS